MDGNDSRRGYVPPDEQPISGWYDCLMVGSLCYHGPLHAAVWNLCNDFYETSQPMWPVGGDTPCKPLQPQVRNRTTEKSDHSKGKRSLSVDWRAVTRWYGEDKGAKAKQPTGTRRPYTHAVLKNKDGQYDMDVLLRKTENWQRDLVVKTERQLRPYRQIMIDLNHTGQTITHYRNTWRLIEASLLQLNLERQVVPTLLAVHQWNQECAARPLEPHHRVTRIFDAILLSSLGWMGPLHVAARDLCEEFYLKSDSLKPEHDVRGRRPVNPRCRSRLQETEQALKDKFDKKVELRHTVEIKWEAVEEFRGNQHPDKAVIKHNELGIYPMRWFESKVPAWQWPLVAEYEEKLRPYRMLAIKMAGLINNMPAARRTWWELENRIAQLELKEPAKAFDFELPDSLKI